MASKTHREYLMWQEYLDEQWNQPDRTDHYLMRILLEVRRMMAKNPQDIDIDDCKINFTKTRPGQTRDPHIAAAQAQALWFGRLGGGDKIRVRVRGE